MAFDVTMFIKRRVLAPLGLLGVIRPVRKRKSFEPYLGKLELRGVAGRFFYATPQAKAWYDPIKPYAKLEYDWVLDNVPLENQSIVDVGSHHGHYSVVLSLASKGTSELISVDPHPMNCALTEINLLLNGARPSIQQCAVAGTAGVVRFSGESSGRLVSTGGRDAEARTLDQVAPHATVVKLDVEGAEYGILPAALDALQSARSWLVEVHPYGRFRPDQLITEFLNRDFDVQYVNRATHQVEPYVLGTPWLNPSTIFATAPR